MKYLIREGLFLVKMTIEREKEKGFSKKLFSQMGK